MIVRSIEQIIAKSRTSLIYTNCLNMHGNVALRYCHLSIVVVKYYNNVLYQLESNSQLVTVKPGLLGWAHTNAASDCLFIRHFF